MESRRVREKKVSLEFIERDYLNDESWIRIEVGDLGKKKNKISI